MFPGFESLSLRQFNYTTKENIMRDKMITAARAHAEGELALHKANVEVYLANPAGIGEHADIMEALQSELDKNGLCI